MSVDSNDLPGAPSQNILGFVRKLIPFSHYPWRNGQKDGPGQQLIITFTKPNTDTDFKHSLGRVPNIYIGVRGQSSPWNGYDASDGTGHWTTTNIRLRSTTLGTFTIWIA